MNKTDIEVNMEKEEMITAEEIKLILDHYRIGKKPLAKLLGWGETTIIRYMDGDTPTIEYSNKLQMLMKYPEYYYNLLLKRKDCLTKVAYRKSKQAVIDYIMSSKISAVAYYIINLCNGDISGRYIQYLLYYAQVFSLAICDMELFSEDCLVNNELIPYRKLYDKMRESGIHNLEIGKDYLMPNEKELVDLVFESMTWYGPRALETLILYDKSHMKISRDQDNNRIFSKETLKTYYKELFRGYQVRSMNDIGRYIDLQLKELKERAQNFL